MDFLATARDAQILTISNAISMLVSSLSNAVELVNGLKVQRKRNSQSSFTMSFTDLEQVEKCLMQTISEIEVAFDDLLLRYGDRARTGDVAQQDTLSKKLTVGEFKSLNMIRLIANINRIRNAAANCLDKFDDRLLRPAFSPQLSLQDKTALLMDYHNLCSSAVLYRLEQAPHSQLAAIFTDSRKSSCKQCKITLVPSKISIPGADCSSWVFINLSGLFRSHCKADGGFTCIWELREPSCYRVFTDVKSLLKHMLAVHVRDDESRGDIEVDGPADGRRGDLQKCGFSVQINGLPMHISGSRLVVPRRFATVPSVVSLGPDSDDESTLFSSSKISLVPEADIPSVESQGFGIPLTQGKIFRSQSDIETDPSYIFERDSSGNSQRPELDSNEVFDMDSKEPQESKKPNPWRW